MNADDEIRAIVKANLRRCEAARYAGGIAGAAVVRSGEQPPANWKYDAVTDYWVPPNVTLVSPRR